MKKLLSQLKLYGALEHVDQYLDMYKDRDEFLVAILQAELNRRGSARMKRHITMAQFPFLREWSELDYSLNPLVEFSTIKQFLDINFIKEFSNLCFVGGPGMGKTHCALAIGLEACRQGKLVKFFTAVDLVTMLEEAKKNLTLQKTMNQLLRLHLLIIDELGYVPFSKDSARLLFDVFSKRYQRGSILVTSNLCFDKWTEIFGSVELTMALIDRFTHRCDIFVFQGDSIRFREAEQRKRKRIDTIVD